MSDFFIRIPLLNSQQFLCNHFLCYVRCIVVEHGLQLSFATIKSGATKSFVPLINFLLELYARCTITLATCSFLRRPNPKILNTQFSMTQIEYNYRKNKSNPTTSSKHKMFSTF